MANLGCDCDGLHCTQCDCCVTHCHCISNECAGCLKLHRSELSLTMHQLHCQELKRLRLGELKPQHLSLNDCAIPSTWWYQARVVADRMVRHG